MIYLNLALRALLTLVFVGAGTAKLFGVSMMVETFDVIGWGQWFRYVTGLVEIGSAALLWIPGFQVIGGAFLTATMFCAAMFHLLVIGPSALPSVILGALSATVVFLYRDQLRSLVPLSPTKS